MTKANKTTKTNEDSVVCMDGAHRKFRAWLGELSALPDWNSRPEGIIGTVKMTYGDITHQILGVKTPEGKFIPH